MNNGRIQQDQKRIHIKVIILGVPGTSGGVGKDGVGEAIIRLRSCGVLGGVPALGGLGSLAWSSKQAKIKGTNGHETDWFLPTRFACSATYG